MAGGSHQLAIDDQEDVLAAALGDMTIWGEQDGLLIAVAHRLGLGQGAIHIETTDLAPRRDHVIADTPPRGNTALDPALDVQIRSEGADEDEEVVFEVMQPDTDGLRALIGDGPDIYILPTLTPLHQLYS